jgi:hypothetical protein
MPITKLININFNDIVNSIQYLLDKASKDVEFGNCARQITSNQEDKISTIYNFTKTVFEYTPDPNNTEIFVSPIKAMKLYNNYEKVKGDCASYALFVTAMARVSGLDSNVVIIDQGNSGWSHAYGRIYSEKLGKFVSCDSSTSDYPLGWEPFYYKIYIVS